MDMFTALQEDDEVSVQLVFGYSISSEFLQMFEMRERLSPASLEVFCGVSQFAVVWTLFMTCLLGMMSASHMAVLYSV